MTDAVVGIADAPARTRSDRPVFWWLIATAVMIFGMVVIGGITRLTESGLSITEWQPVTGALPPLSAGAWDEAFAHYRQIPEYQAVHAGMSLNEFKGIFFWEWLHRLWGRLIGLVALAPLVVFAIRGEVRGPRFWRYAAIPVLVGLQGALGWYMVASGLAVRTSVSQYRLTAHLLLAVAIYGYVVWQAAGLRIRAAEVSPGFRRAAWALLGLVFLTLGAGGFMAGLKAGLTYNTWPLMDGEVVPTGYFAVTPWWLNPFENVTAVQFDHRTLAEITFVAVLGFWVWGRRRAGNLHLRRCLDLMAGVVCLQFGLGIATLLSVVAIPLAALHQAGAVLLFTAAVLTVQGSSGRARG
jgi:cytochrome c oxidase assembly protein subunit 15